MDDFNAKYEKKNPCTVPEGYFDGLTDRIVREVGRENLKKSFSLRRKMFAMGAAAVFVAFLFVVWPKMGNDLPEGALEQVGQLREMEEDIFDSHFNPTNEEIIEYLVSDEEHYELVLAGIY